MFCIFVPLWLFEGCWDTNVFQSLLEGAAGGGGGGASIFGNICLIGCIVRNEECLHFILHFFDIC